MREELAERVRQFRATARPILSGATVLLIVLTLTVSGTAVAQTACLDGFTQVGDDRWSITCSDNVQYENETSILFEAPSENAVHGGLLYNDTIDTAPDNVTISTWMHYNATSNTDPGFYINVNESANEYGGIVLRRFGGTGGVNDLFVRYEENLNDPGTFVAQEDTGYNKTELSEQWIQIKTDVRYLDNGSMTVAFSIRPGLNESMGQVAKFTVTNPTLDPGAYGLAQRTVGTAAGDLYYASGVLDTSPSDGGGDVELELDTRDYIMPNESAPYSVHFNDSGQWSEVTDQATVTSNNTSVLTVDSVEHMLNGQAGVNTTVNVTAEYQASGGTVYSTTKQITVAQATVDNLEILPTIWRFGATFGDDTIFFLIVATLTSIVATRFSTAFGGLSLYWVVIMLGWFSGWVSLGILLLATVMCMFIGLNLAANINYGAVGSFRAGR